MIWKRHLKHHIEYILSNVIYTQILLLISKSIINTKLKTITLTYLL